VSGRQPSPANTIESLNYQPRKIIKNRGHFPSHDAVIKLRLQAHSLTASRKLRHVTCE